MAILSNINGKFAVDSTGAIKFNNLTGTNNQVLIANTGASPTWVDVSTIIGGPYLPLTGGTLAGAGNLVVGGTLTVNGIGTFNTPSGGVAFNVDAFTDGFGVIRFRTNGNASKWDVGMNSSNHFYIGNNGVNTALEIEEVSSNATFSGTITTTDVYGASSLRTAALGGIHYVDASSSLLFRTSGSFTERMRIDQTHGDKTFISSYSGGTFPLRVGYGTFASFTPTFVINDSGNVGIGTTSPDKLLEISHNASSHDPVLRLTGTSNLGYAAGIEWQSGFGPKTSAQIFSTASGSQGGELWINVRRQATNTLERLIYLDTFGQIFFYGQMRLEVAATETNPIVGTNCAFLMKNTSNTDGNLAVIDFMNSTGFITGRIGAQFLDAGDRDTDLMFFTRANGGGLTEKMRITSAGNVNIATPITNAFYGLSLQYNATDTADFKVNQATGQIKIGGVATGYFPTFYAGGSEKMRIHTNGNVGIGVTGPTEKLEISGKVKINSPNAPNAFAELNIGWTGGGETRAIDIDGNWTGNENKSITFTHGSAATNIVGQINCQHNGPGSRIRWGKLYHSGDSSTYTMELISTSQTAANLTVAGNITASADVVAYSDERLKSNIKTLDGSKVLKMRGVSFEKEGKQGSGVIAQELEKVAPELVNNDNEYKGVAYGNLVGYLIEAIKELEARVKELENK